MNFAETLEWLDAVTRTGIKYDLLNIRRLLALLDHPERAFPIVCVAGTNGKGSTCAFLESILVEAGYRVGLNTSPHLVTPRERLRIDRTDAGEAEFAAVMSDIRTLSEKHWRADDPGRPTFFETLTAAALHHFRQQKVDIAIMEAGLGGRLDGTNGTQPALTVITRIGIDHVKTLGGSLRRIAFEKFGLARAGAPLVLAQQRPAVETWLRRLAAFRGVHVYGSDGHWRNRGAALRTPRATYSGLRLGLRGAYQRENAACAVRTAELLGSIGFRIDADAVRAGLAKVRWPGRLELIEGDVRILIDGSHNADGIATFIAELKKIPARRRILIYATMADKQIVFTAGRLLPLVDDVILPPVPVPRAFEPAALARHALDRWNIRAETASSVAAAWERARSLYRPGDLILVAGSLYLVGEFKRTAHGLF